MKTIEKERQKLQKAVSEEKTQRFLEAGAYLLAGFLLARSIVPGVGAPFAVALICISGKNNYYSSALGCGGGLFGVLPRGFSEIRRRGADCAAERGCNAACRGEKRPRAADADLLFDVAGNGLRGRPEILRGIG